MFDEFKKTKDDYSGNNDIFIHHILKDKYQ